MKTCRKNLHNYTPIKGYHHGCPECYVSRNNLVAIKWNKLNKEKRQVITKVYRDKNKEQLKIKNKEYRKNNPDVVNTKTARRRATKFNATPNWLTKQHLDEIQSIYSLASELSWLSEDGLEVDHIIPLQGKNVVGLHVPWNLQILSKRDNCIKGNK